MIKRTLFYLILIVVALIMVVPVFGATWEYKFPISVTDNSSTARTYYPVLLGIDPDNISTYINNNGTDTDMQIGAISIKYMLSTDNMVAVIPNFPADSKVTMNLYTGYSPIKTSFPIVLGYGGYVTTNDTAALELTNNYTISITDIGINANVSDNIVGKDDAFKLTTNGSGNVTLNIYRATSYNIRVKREDATNPRIYEADFRTYSGWVDPDSAAGASWTDRTNIYDNDTGTSTYASPGAGTWSGNLTITTTGLYSDALKLYFDTGIPTSMEIDAYIGGSWTNIYSGAPSSGWNTIELDYLTLSASTGEHDINIYSDSVNLWMDIDGNTTSNITAITIPDNANNYIIGSSAVNYIDSYIETVNGVEVLHYEPTSIISNAQLIDQAGTKNGDITWGSNSNLAITYGEMVSYESTDAVSGNATAGGADVPSAFMPSTWFAMGENVENLPFYGMFYNVAGQLGFPDTTEGTQSLYFIVIIGVAIAVMLGLVMYTRSALAGFLGMVIVLFIGSSMTIVPMWIPFAVSLVGMGIMYLYRQVAY